MKKIQRLYYSDEDEIRELLLGRKVKKVKEDALELDNGIVLAIIPNEG